MSALIVIGGNGSYGHRTSAVRATQSWSSREGTLAVVCERCAVDLVLESAVPAAAFSFAQDVAR